MKKNVLALQRLAINWDDPLALSSLISNHCNCGPQPQKPAEK